MLYDTYRLRLGEDIAEIVNRKASEYELNKLKTNENVTKYTGYSVDEISYMIWYSKKHGKEIGISKIEAIIEHANTLEAFEEIEDTIKYNLEALRNIKSLEVGLSIMVKNIVRIMDEIGGKLEADKVKRWKALQ